MNDGPVKQKITLNDLAVERNVLAVERNELANERTVLAYARTSIMAFLTGMTLFKLYPLSQAMKVVGWISIVLSGILMSIGLYNFIQRYRSLSRAIKARKTAAS